MPIYHVRVVADEVKQSVQRGAPDAVGGTGTLRQDGVADELGDDPPYDVRAHHPREARLEHLDAVVRGKVAAAAAATSCLEVGRGVEATCLFL